MWRFDNQRGVLPLPVLVLVAVGAIFLGIYIIWRTNIFAPREVTQTPTDKTSQLAQLKEEIVENGDLESAKKRKELLLEDIETNPGSLFTNQFDPLARDNLPGIVKSEIEEPIEIEGEIEVVHFDGLENKQSKYEYRLKGKDNKTYKVLPTKELGIQSGDKVKIKGLKLNDQIIVEGPRNPDNSGGGVQVLNVVGAPVVSGNQKTAIILVNFSNDSGQPIDRNSIQQLIFTNPDSVNSFYKENSFNLVSFSGDVFGYYTISADNSSCESNYYIWSDMADSQAMANGVNLLSFGKIIYVFATPPNCAYGGLGTVGGTPARAWIFNYQNDKRMYGHELGHNLGVGHSNSLSCGSKVVDSYANCSETEYGDVFDVMGNFWYVSPSILQFNGPHKWALGWVSGSNVQTVTKKGTYRVKYLENLSSGALVLKVAKPDTNEAYYISYRRPIGFDAAINSGVTGGVSIHIWNGNPAVQPKLLDTTPGVGDFSGFADSALTDGKSFNDPVNKIVITQKSHNANYVDLSVTIR